MQFTEEQKQTIQKWAAEGLGLSDIQKRIASEWGISMTFMDVRLLVIDLACNIKDKPTPKDSKPLPQSKPGPDGLDNEFDQPENPATDGDDMMDPSAPASAGNVSVTLDRIMKPGAIVSGTVRFSDGVNAAWSLDQFGRLALHADKPGYAPPQQDIASFQIELRNILSRKGF